MSSNYDFGPYTVTLPAGVTSVPFEFPINDDDILEDDQFLHISIDIQSLPCGFTIGSVDHTTVVIVNDDCKCHSIWSSLYIFYELMELPNHFVCA